MIWNVGISKMAIVGMVIGVGRHTDMCRKGTQTR